MTNEQLLLPRYKVIANYPMSVWKIGAIIQFEQFGNNVYYELGDNDTRVEYFNKYPAIFRKMKWWEEANEKDVPIRALSVGYVKRNGKVFKVLNNKLETCSCDTELEQRIYLHDLHYWDKSYQPATEEEYNEYLNEIKK